MARVPCKQHDDKLEFEEFRAIIPKGTREKYEEETIRELFDAADYDHNGAISRDEFFFWTLTWAKESSGVALTLESSFKKFDSTGDGQLNLHEFTLAVERFGFGELGHKIFGEVSFAPMRPASLMQQ